MDYNSGLIEGLDVAAKAVAAAKVNPPAGWPHDENRDKEVGWEAACNCLLGIITDRQKIATAAAEGPVTLHVLWDDRNAELRTIRALIAIMEAATDLTEGGRERVLSFFASTMVERSKVT